MLLKKLLMVAVLLSFSQPAMSETVYEMEVSVGGFSSTFEFTVNSRGQVFGYSRWTCCSGFTNKLDGSFDGASLNLTRHLAGQHDGLTQNFRGTLEGSTARGIWTGTGGSGNWSAIVKTSEKETYRWQVDVSGNQSEFVVFEDSLGRLSGYSEWSCCSGRYNFIEGNTTNSSIQFTRFLEGGDNGSIQQFVGFDPIDSSIIVGDWQGVGGTGSWSATALSLD